MPNREELERQYARQLGRLFKQFSGHLLEILEDVGWNYNQIPPSVWDGFTAQERAVLVPFLEDVSLAYAEAMLETTTIGVEWALVNQEAATWAGMYSVLLAGQIDSTSRAGIANAIQRSIGAFFEEGMTMPELIKRLQSDPALERLFTKDVKDRLGRVYGPRRAAMIAHTETTRAASQGQLISMKEIEKTGVKTVATWLTAVDDRVCPICLPLDNQDETHRVGDTPYWTHPDLGSIGPPPAHVNCRCDFGLDFKT